MTITRLTMPEFLTLYAIKPSGAGVDSANGAGHCTAFKTLENPYHTNPLKNNDKNPAVAPDRDIMSKSAVLLHTHPARAGRCTITHTPRQPFHIETGARRSGKIKRILQLKILYEFDKARCTITRAPSDPLYHYTHGGRDAF